MNPLENKDPASLEKRNVYCDPRLGACRLADCNAAVAQIPTEAGDRHFEAEPLGRANEGLPYVWSVGECTVVGSLINPANEEFVSFLDVKLGAYNIIDQCVAPSRIGGTEAVGRFHNFRVMIYQFDYGDYEVDEVNVGPDSHGVCTKKVPQKQDPDDCVLHQGSLNHFVSPVSP